MIFKRTCLLYTISMLTLGSLCSGAEKSLDRPNSTWNIISTLDYDYFDDDCLHRNTTVFFKKSISSSASFSEKCKSVSFSFFPSELHDLYEKTSDMKGPEVYNTNGYVSHILPDALGIVRECKHKTIEEIALRFSDEEEKICMYAGYLVSLQQKRELLAAAIYEYEKTKDELYPFKKTGTTLSDEGKLLIQRSLQQNQKIRTIENQIKLLKRDIEYQEMNYSKRPNPFATALLFELISMKIAEEDTSSFLPAKKELTTVFEELRLLP